MSETIIPDLNFIRRSELLEFERLLDPGSGATIQQVMSAWTGITKRMYFIAEDVTPEPEKRKKPEKTKANPRSRNSLKKRLKRAKALVHRLADLMYQSEGACCPNEWVSDPGNENLPCDGLQEFTRPCAVHGSGELASAYTKWLKTEPTDGEWRNRK